MNNLITPLLIRGRDMTVPTVNTSGALNVSNSNIGRNMTFSCTGTYQAAAALPGYLILTNFNAATSSQIKYTTPGLIPDVNTARDMYIYATVGVTAQIKCYGVDLNGYEKIFYMTCNGNTAVTTAYTDINGTGVSFEISGSQAQLRHINFIEDLVPRTSGNIYISTMINGIDLVLIENKPTYTNNPIYLCPYGRRTVMKGINYLFTSATTKTYTWLIFNSDVLSVSYSAPHFSSKLYTTSGTITWNTNKWSSTGSITIEGGYWLVLSSDDTTAASIEIRTVLCEYKC